MHVCLFNTQSVHMSALFCIHGTTLSVQSTFHDLISRDLKSYFHFLILIHNPSIGMLLKFPLIREIIVLLILTTD
jgi:hypothetical protein